MLKDIQNAVFYIYWTGNLEGYEVDMEVQQLLHILDKETPLKLQTPVHGYPEGISLWVTHVHLKITTHVNLEGTPKVYENEMIRRSHDNLSKCDEEENYIIL